MPHGDHQQASHHGQAGDGHASHGQHGHGHHDHGHHDHGHHGHGHHDHGADPAARGFIPGMLLNLGFTAFEAVAGVVAGSMALVADAGHNLSDVLGLGLAWMAVVLARRRPSPRRTYGWHRGTILAALANAALLLVAVGAILAEAVGRLLHPAPVETGPMLWVALAGVVVNTATALLFARGREHDINRRGAFLHMAADAAVSLAVVVGALVIRATGWLWVDPALGLVVAMVILAGTWGLLRDSMALAMDMVPPRLDPAAVQGFLAGLPGVVEVHDLHIWALGTTEVALTAHLVRPGAGLDDGFLLSTCAALRGRFGIGHATLQLETGSHGCPLAPAEVV
jgi:cobalt-zinc-cadmium efflux system protein